MDDENLNNQSNAQADNNSIAIGKIDIDGNVSGTITIGNTYYATAEEDVPLRSGEIENGLNRFSAFLSERAPVLQERFSFIAKKLRATLGAELNEISPVLKTQRLDMLNEMVILCPEVLDISFRALCKGKNPPPYDSRPPFLGLFAFRPEDREFYFGRELLIQKLVEKFRQYAFLAVVGASGSGKSSLVMAGLIPALDAQMTYFTPSSVPMYQLITAQERADKDTVFVVDQFEELFTLTRDSKEREEFIKALLELARKNRVVITMRADFWGEVAPHPELKQVMQEHQELIAPMDTAELRSVIEQQAAAVGLRFDPTLTESILDEVEGEPGAMPLLQHALWLLWNRRHGLWLKADEYRAFGGVKQAIASTAEDVYASCPEPEQDRLRNIFLRLTRLDDSGEGRDTRRRVMIQELLTANEDLVTTTRLLNKLADARLIVKTDNEVEVAHEALIRHWRRLTDWLNEDRNNLRLCEGISEDAREWAKSGHDESLLNHRGGRLEIALALSQNPHYQFNPIEHAYLKACVEIRDRTRAEKEQQQQRELAAAKKLAETSQAQAYAERRSKLTTRGFLALAVMIALLLSYEPMYRLWLQQQAAGTDLATFEEGDYKFKQGENIPQEAYHLSAFSIDASPVTNERYILCIDAGVCSRPDALQSEYANPTNAHKLVVNITALDAAEFCHWLGMRLPSEKEWELAVRENKLQPIDPHTLIDATSFYEWTTTPYDPNEPEWTEISKDPPEWITQKGGQLSQDLDEYVTFRQNQMSTQPDYTTGFRCLLEK